MSEEDKIAQLEARIATIEKRVTDASRNAAEAVWAQIFHDTIRDSSWLKNKTFSPGRWAVGYAYLYVLYRILNEMRPKNILDLGLGQTSWMIAQYAKENPDVTHVVVEASQEWIDFWGRRRELPCNTRIVRLDYVIDTENFGDKVRVFSGFKEALQGMKFDVISIDAPLGSDMRYLSRVDVLKLIPDQLSSSFVILKDDTHRQADRAAVEKIEQALSASGIKFASHRYLAAKDFHALVTEDLSYFLTL